MIAEYIAALEAAKEGVESKVRNWTWCSSDEGKAMELHCETMFGSIINAEELRFHQRFEHIQSWFHIIMNEWSVKTQRYAKYKRTWGVRPVD